MHILGIVGGIASGKSAVSAALGELGATVLDADQAAHAVLQQEEVKQTLLRRWGEEILDAAGQVDRTAVAKHVFANSPESAAERQFLEQTIHPRIRRHFESQIDNLARRGAPAVVVDAPLLLEAGWGNLCDDVIFVDCNEQTRLERASRRGWTKTEFRQREAAQMPIPEKRRKATVEIDNSGTPESLLRAVRDLWNSRWHGSAGTP